MLSNGRSKENLHNGTTKIASGDLEIDGSLIVDNIQVNSLSIDGYTLPTSAGTDGQVITMNPDNTTTSFQDVSIPTLVDQRVCLNRWFSINQREKFGASQGTILFNENDVGSAVTGHRTIGTCVIPADDIDALDENFSILTLQIRNDILNSNPVDPNQIQFYLVLTTGGVTSSVQFEVMDYQGLVTGIGAPLQSMLEHQIRFARSINDASKILISVKGMKPTDTTGTGNTNTDKPFASHNNLKNGAVTGDIFIFDFPQQDNNTGVYLDNYVSGNDITIDIQAERPPVAGTNIINSALVMGRLDSYIKQNLPSGGPVVNDHLLLSNLNGGTGDGGHINLYDLRGVKPMTGDVNMNSNNINNVSQVNGQGGLNLMEINNTNGLMLVDGAELRLTADTSIKLYPTVDLRLGAGGSNIIINPSSEVDVQGGINMNTNDITNANVIVRASDGNVINFDNDIFPPLVTGALTVESGAGKEININADNVLRLNGNSIIYNSGTGPHQFNDTGGLQAQFTSANIEMFKNLDMKNNNINNVNQVSSSGTLTLLGALGNRCDIGVAGATRLEVEDSRVLISQFADFNIQDQIIYVQPGTMPTLFQDGKTYIFVGSRTTNTPIVLNNINVTFKGTSRDTSSIEYTGTGSFITSTDCNLSISDLTLKCNVAGSLLLTASNPSKLKVLSILNCEVIDTYEFSDISGHELVDINNCLFIHLRGDGVLTNQKCLYINGVAKTNITSCEIVKFFEIGQPANTNPFDGAMIYITGACGAISIIGGIIHPRVNQRAVEIDNTATFLEFALNTNNFIDIGLTTGTILQTNSNASWDTNATAEANSLLPNLKSFVGAQLSAQNTNNTATVLNTPVDINLGTLLTPFAGFGVTVGSGGGVTYNRKRPVNFQVTFVANLQAITGGAGQRIALSTSKNGVNTGIKSFVTLDSAGTEPKQCTLTLIGTATQGDLFRSQLINETTTSNIRCLDLLVSGIEI